MREMISNVPVGKVLLKKEQVENRAEKEDGFDMEVFVTDHSPDNQDTGDQENLGRLYRDIAGDGVDRVRYDFHWGKLEGQPGKFDRGLLSRYKNAKNIQAEVGLKEPIIILSNPPEWAKKLYSEGKKEEFYEAFRKYAEEVESSLAQAGGEKVTTVQILNELNNSIYTPVAMEDIPKLCQITREVFREYNPDLKLSCTIIAGNTSKFVSKDKKDAKVFLSELKEIKDSFDKIVIDYYPGTWHLPLSEVDYERGLTFLQWPPTKGVFKELVKQVGYLREVLEEVAQWGVDYEIGEVGMPSKFPWGGEKSQRYFYDVFFRAFKHLLIDFRKRGIKLPSALGLYEAIDEPPRNAAGKVLDKFTPHPEARFGMRQADGKRKSILQGRIHPSQNERKETGRSQLRANIDYLRAPMKNLKNKKE